LEIDRKEDAVKSYAQIISELLVASGVDYGDVRVVETRTQGIVVENGKVSSIISNYNMGFGVRVLKGGFWGFSSSNQLTALEAEKVIKEAIAIAGSSRAIPGKGVVLSDEDIYVDDYRSHYEIDPFSVDLGEKIDLLLEVDGILRKASEIKVTRLFLDFQRVRKVFASTEGALIEQEIVESGGGYSVYAIGEGEFQVRSYPCSGGNYAAAGYEFVKEMKLAEEAERIREEARALLSARDVPEGEYDIILGSHQMALQVHESIGHAVELDRVLGYEASYAGTSFVTTDKLDKFRYGSELMNVYADATTPGGLGTFGYDDEGVKAQRVPIVKNGIFVGYLSSRETAPFIGRRSSGAMRAESWSRIPIIRMTNINLEPGTWDLEDLIADTKEGLFLDFNRSWSIDQERLNFQFGTEIAWLIKGGKRVEILKNPVYTGITPEFWASMDAVGNAGTWKLWGIPNCGKGEPGQIAHVGHGVPVARFRKVKVRPGK